MYDWKATVDAIAFRSFWIWNYVWNWKYWSEKKDESVKRFTNLDGIWRERQLKRIKFSVWMSLLKLHIRAKMFFCSSFKTTSAHCLINCIDELQFFPALCLQHRHHITHSCLYHWMEATDDNLYAKSNILSLYAIIASDIAQQKSVSIIFVEN